MTDRYAGRVLRTKASRSSSLRLLNDRDRDDVLELCDRDPVVNVFVSSRVHEAGLDPVRLGGQMWGFVPGGKLTSACYAGANLVPVGATPAAADRLRRAGPAAGHGAARPSWARRKPSGRCGNCCAPTGASPGRSGKHSRSWRSPARRGWPPTRICAGSGPASSTCCCPASVAMFTEEVGVSPLGPDGGAAYRARVAELIALGRAFARIEDGRVMFKAEVGAVTPHACQVQGVWVRPELRGQGLAVAGMAAVVQEALRSIAPVVSLYVNDFNAPARAVYRKVGFTEQATLTSILF